MMGGGLSQQTIVFRLDTLTALEKDDGITKSNVRDPDSPA